MSSKNKFGFAPLDTPSASPRRSRSPGPMGAAVRDTAENLQEATEAKVEQRRKNAEDANAFRAAQSDGRVLQSLSLSDIYTDALPRDRLELESVAASDEMEELKSSIRARGQKEPIEVYVDTDGRFQLKKGWRRFTALSQLHGETGAAEFATVMARVDAGQGARLDHYIDMVEENVVREDLTFAEMAQVAMTAAADSQVEEADASEMVNRLYAALHKTKRSYIRSFVFLLTALGDALQWPRAVPRNLGLDVARLLRSVDQVEALKSQLTACSDSEAQNKALAAFIEVAKGATTVKPATKPAREKFEFFVGKTKVTARAGEVRMVSDQDFATLPKKALQDAVKAFEQALKAGAKP